MFLVALAAQITAPAPESVRWFTPADVPMALVQQGSGLWVVPVRVNVAPDGAIRSCEADPKMRQDAALTNHTCEIIRRRAKFRAATIDGVPVDGVYRTTVKYAVADTPWNPAGVAIPDVDVDVERMPPGLQSTAVVKVMFTVDSSGTTSSCAADEGPGFELVNNHPALVAAACDQIKSVFRPTPATVSGKPVVSVQNAFVRFRAPSQAR